MYIGKHVNSPLVRMLSQGLYIKTFKYDKSFYYEDYDEGLSVGIDYDSLVQMFSLQETDSLYTRYRGVIPYNLSFEDDLRDLNNKLGVYSSRSETKTDEILKGSFALSWSEKGVCINFDYDKFMKNEYKIVTISFF